MKGLVAYSTDEDRWVLMGVNLFFPNSYIDPDTFLSLLTKEGQRLYIEPTVVSVEEIRSTGCDSYAWSLFDWGELPNVECLEDRIKSNIKKLSGYEFKYLKRGEG